MAATTGMRGCGQCLVKFWKLGLRLLYRFSSTWQSGLSTDAVAGNPWCKVLHPRYPESPSAGAMGATTAIGTAIGPARWVF